MTRGSVAVIGAGMVGVACAEELRRDGWRVTLIDRTGPAAETSSGNAGLVVANTATPVQFPGVAAAALRQQIFGGPFHLDWRRLPQLLPWLRRFAAGARAPALAEMCRATVALACDAEEAHARLAEGTPAARYLASGVTWLHLFRSDEPADGWGYRARREAGYTVRPVPTEELRARDPALNPAYRSAWALPGAGRVSDPGAYIRALAAHFEAGGGRFLQAEAAAVRETEAGVAVDLRGGGCETADRAVIAAGVWSETLLRALGVRGWILSERGYHVEYWAPSAQPPDGWAYMTADTAHVANAMAGRLRITSVSEPAAIDSPPNRRAEAYVAKGAALIYPDLRYERRTQWMGRRPTTPDSLPLIGTLADAPRVAVAAGHQHWGLTVGPRTGRLVADLLADRRPNIDMSPYRPERFSA